MFIKSTEITERLLNLVIRPYAKELAAIMVTGRIACLVFEPSEDNKQAAAGLGWDGKMPVFAMDEIMRGRLAEALKSYDPVCSSWLIDQRYRRMFVLIHNGSLLVNHNPDNQFSIEPNSDRSMTN